MDRRFLPLLPVLALLAACSAPETERVLREPPRPAPVVEAPVVGAREAEPVPAAPEPEPEEPAPVEAASAPETADPATDAEAEAPDELAPPVGFVAGSRLEAAELLEEWHDLAPRELWLVVDRVVATRLAVAEARRLGIRLDETALEERLSFERDELRAEMERRGLDLTLEAFVRQELGRDPRRYLDRLRQATLRQMLAERAVRAASLGAETVDCRILVVRTEEEMDAARAELAKGRPFADVARELSLDDTAAEGGRVPFLVRQEGSPLARLAFQTEPGAVGGPLVAGDVRFLVLVEELRPPLEGDWAALEAAVEESLRQHAVSDPEFLRWKLTMERRYPIDLQPLQELLGSLR